MQLFAIELGKLELGAFVWPDGASAWGFTGDARPGEFVLRLGRVEVAGSRVRQPSREAARVEVGRFTFVAQGG